MHNPKTTCIECIWILYISHNCSTSGDVLFLLRTACKVWLVSYSPQAHITVPSIHPFVHISRMTKKYIDVVYAWVCPKVDVVKCKMFAFLLSPIYAIKQLLCYWRCSFPNLELHASYNPEHALWSLSDMLFCVCSIPPSSSSLMDPTPPRSQLTFGVWPVAHATHFLLCTHTQNSFTVHTHTHNSFTVHTHTQDSFTVQHNLEGANEPPPGKKSSQRTKNPLSWGKNCTGRKKP